MQPFRFLAGPPDDGTTEGVVDAARRAEAIGYDGFVIPDHLVTPIGALPALAAIAVRTERIRLGTFVLNNDLRHPAVLAQDLATIDVLSGGRLDIGIGAGWNKPEYDAIGLPYQPNAVRVERLAEAVAVLQGLYGDEPFTFAGTHYAINGATCEPRPVQRPHPPFLIGGGSRRVLELAAREAQIVGFAPRPSKSGLIDIDSYTAAGTAEKVAWVRAAAGPRFGDLLLNVYPSMTQPIVTDDARAAARDILARIAPRLPRDVTEDEFLDSPHIFIGSIDALTEKVRDLRERFGISVIMTGGVDELAPVVERLAGT